MGETILISDAAKEVKVESHVLRYWEEELQLPIRRNDLGHRYYTEEDVERFCMIKELKERGFQLKAIKAVLQEGSLETVCRYGIEGAMKSSKASEREAPAREAGIAQEALQTSERETPARGEGIAQEALQASEREAPAREAGIAQEALQASEREMPAREAGIAQEALQASEREASAREAGIAQKALQASEREAPAREAGIAQEVTRLEMDHREEVRQRVLQRENAVLCGAEPNRMAIEILESRDLQPGKELHMQSDVAGASQSEEFPDTWSDEADLSRSEKDPHGHREGRLETWEIPEAKVKRIQWLLRRIIQETVRESSEEFSKVVKENMIKEMDYQFRLQEERQEEREREYFRQSEEYYHKKDELIREKSKCAGRRDKKPLPSLKQFFQAIRFHETEST